MDDDIRYYFNGTSEDYAFLIQAELARELSIELSGLPPLDIEE